MVIHRQFDFGVKSLSEENMPEITAIGFDADDTLWESEIHYVNSKKYLAQLLTRFASFDQVDAALEATETRNVQIYGYGFKSFTLSMIETAIQISQGTVPATEIEQILLMARQALQSEIVLMDGVERVLSELSPLFSLILITKGELFEQQRKIRGSGLARYFHLTEVLPDKTTEAYLKILHSQNIPPEQFLMVGNSLRSDILPVVSIEGWAVLVPHPLTWAHEMNPGKEITGKHWFEIDRLSDLPAFLDNFTRRI
jgi:putative hydrolase of the HAD superfamily